ncbi:M23 family metallopeptidase [Curtobacterium flaccumfaciens]|uniref:M23 family metallopeptidase n=1 Tax=Curtobacterium flaccumfaciens TaxID=2035 RepID=UPI00188A437D|nr:M23 family metallopeptidase [Curtobacterium flaccumfaciens]MBF4629281.1 M23 family metallopeptidase [Curtobacterium flaccumfaciens]
MTTLTPITSAPTTVHRTRREALAAERAAHQPRPLTTLRRPPLPTPVAPVTLTSRRVSTRRAPSLLTATGAAAAAVLFAAAALPGPTSAAAAPVAPLAAASPEQTLTVTAAAVDPTLQRDSFTISATAPAPAPATAQAAAAVGAVTGGGDVQWPFAGPVPMSSGFGYRIAPCASCSTSHQGLDLTPGSGTPIGVVAAGRVRVAGWHSEFGQYAIIDHQINGQQVSTLYAHMIPGSSPLRTGQQVAAGDRVGLVGSSGRSTGAHLHLEVHQGGTTPINPETWLRTYAGRNF